jgi:hypothetical protein
MTASPLAHAILETLAYAEVFAYPLRPSEIHRYLIDCPATLAQVQAALAGEAVLQQRVCHQDGYYWLCAGHANLEIRRQRQAQALFLWPLAQRYAHLIQQLPFVRMVALTGALAMQNEPGVDIDYLIITTPGRLWLCRALVIALVYAAQRRGVTLCPNYFLSQRALVFNPQTLYSAHEVTQMIPLGGFASYQQLRQLNQWTTTYLPNAFGAPSLPEMPLAIPAGLTATAGVNGNSRLQSLAETALNLPLVTPLENWERRRKIAKLSAIHSGAINDGAINDGVINDGVINDGAADPISTIESQQPSSATTEAPWLLPEAWFGVDCCKGHIHPHAQPTLQAYQAVLARIEVD